MVNNGLYNMLFGEDKNASRFLEMLDLERDILVIYTANVCNYDLNTLNNEKNICYHVSSTPPSIVCKEGLNATTAIDRMRIRS